MDDADRRKFVEILTRYLSPGVRRDARGKAYRQLSGAVRVVTFALMRNHFHLVLFQVAPGGMEDLMRRVTVAYTRYYRERHGGEGSLFAGPYRSDHKADRRSQLTAIAYVHDNHGDQCHCEFCGSRYFEDHADSPGWIDSRRGVELFGGRAAYRQFRASRHSLRDVTASSYG